MSLAAEAEDGGKAPHAGCRRCGHASTVPSCDCWPHAAVPDAVLAELTKVVLVGEDNPYGEDLRNALVCWPDRCAGDRMRRLVCGLPEAEYLALWRVNLCASNAWSLKDARAHAPALVDPAKPWRVVVLLGNKVATAFEQVTVRKLEPFSTCMTTRVADAVGGRYGEIFRCVAIPHPKGLSREWNIPGAFDRARALLREVAPGVPWGSAL